MSASAVENILSLASSIFALCFVTRPDQPESFTDDSGTSQISMIQLTDYRAPCTQVLRFLTSRNGRDRPYSQHTTMYTFLAVVFTGSSAFHIITRHGIWLLWKENRFLNVPAVSVSKKLSSSFLLPYCLLNWWLVVVQKSAGHALLVFPFFW